ncbi:unnamed protein product [Lampetra planeri]
MERARASSSSSAFVARSSCSSSPPSCQTAPGVASSWLLIRAASAAAATITIIGINIKPIVTTINIIATPSSLSVGASRRPCGALRLIAAAEPALMGDPLGCPREASGDPPRGSGSPQATGGRGGGRVETRSDDDRSHRTRGHCGQQRGERALVLQLVLLAVPMVAVLMDKRVGWWRWSRRMKEWRSKDGYASQGLLHLPRRRSAQMDSSERSDGLVARRSAAVR